MDGTGSETPARATARWVALLLVLGGYLTLRGYHSFDGDQAYRLPLLLHQQDPSRYATDPFVRAFDAFNPHRGYLTLLDLASRPFGLAAALAGLFALTWATMALGVDRLTRAVWPEKGPWTGVVAVVLILLAKAGNVGTNHLFEATLLDRLIGFALGWIAIAGAVAGTRNAIGVSAGAIGLATLVHPSVGLQLGLTLAAGWLFWSIRPAATGTGWKQAGMAIVLIGVALVPGLLLMRRQGGSLFEGLPEAEFRSLAVLIQGPQHMLPSLWRRPQWIAWGCFPVLGLLSLCRVGMPDPSPSWPASRVRFLVLMAVNLISLGLAYLAVEVVGDLRVTLFQPFRMATLARGLALIAVAARVQSLWTRGEGLDRLRATLLAVGLSGDRMLTLATLLELALTLADLVRARSGVRWIVTFAVLVPGLVFLARHDTEAGHIPILVALVTVGVWQGFLGHRGWTWNRRRVALAVVLSWTVPVLALLGPPLRKERAGLGLMGSIVARCRFAEVPCDDLERLADWCRTNTPETALFVGPPGPKEFRLWSRRAVAFNRAASPYHAAGLADWAARYRDHVAFQGSTADFVRAYLADRHAMEARFNALTDAELTALALRQGATHVLLEGRKGAPRRVGGTLEWLRTEGRYRVYRVRSSGDQGLPGPDLGESRIELIPASRTSLTTRATAAKD